MKRMILLAVAASASLASGAWAGPIILNPSFESPALTAGTFREGNPPADWTYVGLGGSSGGGIVTNGSAYGNSNAPDGNQALLLKSLGGVSQVLSGFVPGAPYEVSFYAEARTNYDSTNPFQVLINGTPLTFGGLTTVTPTAGQNSYALFTSAPFTVGSSTPTLAFNGLSAGDNSSFVDLVKAVPEPASLVLIGLGGVGLLAVARRRRNA